MHRSGRPGGRSPPGETMCFGVFLWPPFGGTQWRTSGCATRKMPPQPSTGMLEPLKNAKCSVGASDCHSKMNSFMVIHYHLVYLYIYTVWWTNIAMETKFEDVSLKMRDFHFHVLAMYIYLFNEQTWTIVVCCPFAVLCTQSEWLQLSSFFLQNFSFPSNLQIEWTTRTPKNSSWSTPPFNRIVFPFKQCFWESMFVCSCRMID